jgi:hypothetical protein
MGRPPLVDFCNRNDPRARPVTSDQSNPAHRTGSRPPAQLLSRVATLGPANELPFGRLLPERGQPRAHGSGTEIRVLSPLKTSAPPRRDRSRRELRPNPIGSDTSCRKLVTSQVGVPTTPGRHFVTSPYFPSLPDDRRLRGARLPGPPPARFREEPSVPPHPRCLPSSDTPRPGQCPFTPQPVPSLWSPWADAFSIFVLPPP